MKLSASPGIGILIQACDEQAADKGGIHSKGTIWVGCTVYSVVLSRSGQQRRRRLVVVVVDEEAEVVVTIMVGWEKIGPLARYGAREGSMAWRGSVHGFQGLVDNNPTATGCSS